MDASNYCHDCSLYNLKFRLALKGYFLPIVSDPTNRIFTIVKNNLNLVISAENLTLSYDTNKQVFFDFNSLFSRLIQKLSGEL